MDEILKVDTIEQYNDLFGFETLHPLVAIVDLNKPESQRREDDSRLLFPFPEGN